MEINNNLKEYADHKKRFIEKISASLNDAFREFFEKVGDEITCITWNQFTPYFNDGEACVFSVNDVYFSNVPPSQIDDITDWGEYDGELDEVFSVLISEIKSNERGFRVKAPLGRGFRVKTPLGLSQETIQACIDIDDVISDVYMKEILESVFGDHVVVRVTKSGIHTSEIDHD